MHVPSAFEQHHKWLVLDPIEGRSGSIRGRRRLKKPSGECVETAADVSKSVVSLVQFNALAYMLLGPTKFYDSVRGHACKARTTDLVRIIVEKPKYTYKNA